VQGHLESLQQEQKDSALDELVPVLREHVCSTLDWSYLYQAHSVLLECRRVLSNAYVFQYFMFDPECFQQVCFYDFLCMCSRGGVGSSSHRREEFISILQACNLVVFPRYLFLA
jgi:hypothetical protein